MPNDIMSEGSAIPGERRQARSDAGRSSPGYTQLFEAGEESRRRHWRANREPARNNSSALKRNWRISAGATALVMFSMAATGLVAIFSTIKEGRASPSQVNEGNALPPAASVRSSGQGMEGTNGRASTKVSLEETVKEGRAQPQGEQSDSRPNVFFIMIDDMGWGDIGYQSVDLQGMTPNLDRLAAGGVKMTNYYSMAICTPARGSLMTGRYVVRYGLQFQVIQPTAPWSLPLTEKIFPEYMKDAGYETHMVGKWHLGSYTTPVIPSQRGFDTFMGYLNDEETYWSHQSYTCEAQGQKIYDFGFGNATGYYDIIDRYIPDHPRPTSNDETGMKSDTTTLSSSVSGSGERGFLGKYSTQVFHDRVIDVLEQKTPFDDEPLYMYLSHQAVHSPLGLPPEGCFSEHQLALLDELQRGSDPDGHLRVRFAKVLMFLDKTIGEMVDYMEREGWMENSIIVVASDNGGCPKHGGSNYPLRGTKYSYWEGGNKVPAFVYSTSHIPEDRWGTVYDGLMHVTDWLPTIASAVGMTLNGGWMPDAAVDKYGGHLPCLGLLWLNMSPSEAYHFPPILINATVYEFFMVGPFHRLAVRTTNHMTTRRFGRAGPFDGIDQWDHIVGKGNAGAGMGSDYPREEMLYNLDPYILWAPDDDIYQSPDNFRPQGAFRSGKYKLLMNEWCTGWYTFSEAIHVEDPRTTSSEICGGKSCFLCFHCMSYVSQDYLFDLEADPTEERNIIHLYPEIAERLRERMLEVAFDEWTDSLHVPKDRQAYSVWVKYNWWMVPWWELVEESTEDSLGINSTTSSSSKSAISSSLSMPSS